MKAFSAVLSAYPFGASKRAADDIQLWHASSLRLAGAAFREGLCCQQMLMSPLMGSLTEHQALKLSFLRCDVTCPRCCPLMAGSSFPLTSCQHRTWAVRPS